MFRFTQEPSSGSSPVLSWNYKMFFSVLVSIDAVNVMHTYQPVVQACGKPKHVTASVIILNCFNISVIL
jgi:hypothetical protein